MIELRWVIEEWNEYRDDMAIHHKDAPVLQYRTFGPYCGWSTWQEVPIVHSTCKPEQTNE